MTAAETGGTASPYDLMVPVYDRLYDGELSGRIKEAATVARFCSTPYVNAKSILDLGSGTGAVFAQLSKIIRLDEMVGVEQSPK